MDIRVKGVHLAAATVLLLGIYVGLYRASLRTGVSLAIDLEAGTVTSYSDASYAGPASFFSSWPVLTELLFAPLHRLDRLCRPIHWTPVTRVLSPEELKQYSADD